MLVCPKCKTERRIRDFYSNKKCDREKYDICTFCIIELGYTKEYIKEAIHKRQCKRQTKYKDPYRLRHNILKTLAITTHYKRRGGYNKISGYTLTEETKTKMSISAKKRYAENRCNLNTKIGNRRSKESIEKQKATIKAFGGMKGKATDSTREKMSIAKLGKTHTQETILKQRAGVKLHYERQGVTHPSILTPIQEERMSKLLSYEWNKEFVSWVQPRWTIEEQRLDSNRELMRLFTKKRHLDGQWYGSVVYNARQDLYCEMFTTELKERVRSFFGYICPECGTPQNGQKLQVHHVWYNKKACCDDTPRTLIPLCPSCHAKTNSNRIYWSGHFQNIIDTYYDGKCWFTKEEYTALNAIK